MMLGETISRAVCAASAILILGMAGPRAAGDTRLVLSSLGHLTPRRNVYYQFFQFTNPAETVVMLGPMLRWESPVGLIRGLMWFEADSEGDAWTGPGIWPSFAVTERVRLDTEARYLLGWGDASDRLQLILRLQYRLDELNSVRLQASLNSPIPEPEEDRWFVGPMWLRDLGGGMQFRLFWQQEVDGPESRITITYGFNL